MTLYRQKSFNALRSGWIIFITRVWLYAVLVVATAIFSGCRATYFAGSSDAPGNYRVYVKVRGAYGCSFSAETKKSIFVNIVKTGKVEKSLLQKKYCLNGSDICWQAAWDKDNNLTLAFFDYGSGANRWDARKNGLPKRQIRTIKYGFESKANVFTEKSELVR
jgi:hypothetical protein